MNDEQIEWLEGEVTANEYWLEQAVSVREWLRVLKLGSLDGYIEWRKTETEDLKLSISNLQQEVFSE